MRSLIRMLLLLLLGCLMAVPALADDVCTVKDATAATHVTTDCAYLRVQCPLEERCTVTVSVHDEWGYLIYQRNYGECSGSFRSGDIHLPLDGDSARYNVTFAAGDAEYRFAVTRKAAKTTDSTVFAGGLTLKEMIDGNNRKYAVVLDLDILNGQTVTAPMMASGTQVGEVYFTVRDGKVTVSASLVVDGQIDKANVYIAQDAITAKTLGSSRFTGIKTKLDKTVDLNGAPYAAVMVQLTVTYDPATAWAYATTREEENTLQQMREDWLLMQQVTINEAVG